MLFFFVLLKVIKQNISNFTHFVLVTINIEIIIK